MLYTQRTREARRSGSASSLGLESRSTRSGTSSTCSSGRSHVSIRLADEDGTSDSDGSSGSSPRRSGTRRSPTGRSPIFSSLSRMRFTRATIKDMVRYLLRGTTPAGWSRARAWRFRQQMGAFTWRVRTRPAAAEDDMALTVGTGTDSHNDSTAGRSSSSKGSKSSSGSSRSSASSASSGTSTADVKDTALEVQLPDPSADGRASPRPALVWLRVLAEEDVDAALHALYIDPAQGSLRGAKALYERALAQYVGVTMRSVQSFLRRQETRQAVLPKQGYLVVQPADAEDVGHWQADLTDVPLFTSSDAPHMLVCVDMFSKYAWAVPLMSKHAAHIVAALEAIMLQEGPPDTLHTDGGSDMNNGDMAALCRRFNVARKVCAPYNSQCNGGVERLHRTLKDALLRQAHEWMSAAGTVDWVSMLPHVLYGYNTSVHATTGYTPFYLQRGRKPRPLGPLPLAARHGSAAAGPLFHGHAVSACPAPVGRSNGVPASDVAHIAAAAAAEAREEVDTGMETDTDKAHDISRVIATRKDAVHKETRYWVRWAGLAASRDSWITAPMAGVSDRQLQAWVRRTHRSYMPVALPEPFVTPQGRERLHVRVSDADRDALAVAQGQLEGGTASSCACAGDAAAIAIRDIETDAAARLHAPHAGSPSGRGAVLHELEDALHRALAIARLLQPLTEQGAQHP